MKMPGACARLAVCLAFLAGLPAAAARTPTLEAILSAPFPSEILPSPTGGRLTWIQNDRGVRNLWVAGPPDYRGRQVTRYDQDDGQALANVEWTPDAKTLFYVRGGGANGQGEVPNPTSDPAGAEQAVWRISAEVEGGGPGIPVKIGPGTAPAVSPKGDGVAFVRKGQVLWAPLDGSREPAPLVQTRGRSGSLRWSPDGSKLAFVSDRGNHSFIGVYDMAAKTVRWLAPDRKELLFSSNQDDIDRRHLWKVSVAGGPPVAITRGTGIEWMPAIASDGTTLAYIQAGTRSPARVMVRAGSAAAREIAPGTVPADFPEAELP